MIFGRPSLTRCLTTISAKRPVTNSSEVSRGPPLSTRLSDRRRTLNSAQDSTAEDPSNSIDISELLKDSRVSTPAEGDAKTSKKHRKKLKLLAAAVAAEEHRNLNAGIDEYRAQSLHEGATLTLPRWNSG